LKNYERRIYDAFSVLRAAGIISKVDGAKLFYYNSHVLEGTFSAEQKWGQSAEMADNLSNTADVAETDYFTKALHKNIIQVISETQKEVDSAQKRIQDRLAYLKKISSSNLSLRRLIKRNMKREEKISSMLLGHMTIDRKLEGKRDKKCMLPFYVAKYTPDPNGVPQHSIGKSQGILKKDSYIKLASKTPIHAFEAQECLDFFDLDSESEEPFEEDTGKLNECSVARNFFRQEPNQLIRGTRLPGFQPVVAKRGVRPNRRMPESHGSAHRV